MINICYPFVPIQLCPSSPTFCEDYANILTPVHGYFFAFQKHEYCYVYATLSNGNRISGKCHHTVLYVTYQATHNIPIIVCDPTVSQTGVPWEVPNKHCVFPTFLYTKYVTDFSNRTHMPICDGMTDGRFSSYPVHTSLQLPAAPQRSKNADGCPYHLARSCSLFLATPFCRRVTQKTNFFV
jgi:hypothetical protein